MTTHGDTEHDPDIPSRSQVIGDILANIGDAATSALPEHWKNTADVIVALLPYAGDIRTSAGPAAAALLARLTSACRRRSPRR